MRLPIQRMDSYTVPATGSVSHDVEVYVARRVSELVSDFPEDPVLEVSSTTRGDYVEVMIFTGKQEIQIFLKKNTDTIRKELRAMGVSTAFYVRTWTGFPQSAQAV